MLINIPRHEGDPAGEQWLNPSFIVCVSDTDPADATIPQGARIDTNEMPEGCTYYTPITAKAVAQLCYEAKHNI